eukprot:m.6532 g.6532  ORF g.6532 m.6532 type:complete len:191 (+) comp16177_c0_seq1:64-636(+)
MNQKIQQEEGKILLEESSQLALSLSNEVITKNADAIKNSFKRQIDQWITFDPLQSPEKISDFQKAYNDKTWSELKDINASYCDAAKKANKGFIAIKEKSKKLSEEIFDEAFDKVSMALPVGGEHIQTAGQSIKDSAETMGNMVQAGADNFINFWRLGLEANPFAESYLVNPLNGTLNGNSASKKSKTKAK